MDPRQYQSRPHSESTFVDPNNNAYDPELHPIHVATYPPPPPPGPGALVPPPHVTVPPYAAYDNDGLVPWTAQPSMFGGVDAMAMAGPPPVVPPPAAQPLSSDYYQGNSTRRGYPTSEDEDIDTSTMTKEELRRHKNRQSASRSRQRTRSRMEMLEQKVRELTMQNHSLEAQRRELMELRAALAQETALYEQLPPPPQQYYH